MLDTTSNSGEHGRHGTAHDSEFDTRMPLCEGVDIEDMSVQSIQGCLEQGRFTSRQMVECYLERICRLDDRLRAVIEVNPDAIDIADAMDQERKKGIVRGPLHGIPYFVKDNIATKDKVATTAGSKVLEGTTVVADADVVAHLRCSGAVLMGHTNMTEWACMRTSNFSDAYSPRGGQCRNAYNLEQGTGGSSSGSAVAVAANMCAFSLGTETDTSIIYPADRLGLVGFKPSLGLVSCKGVIPESRNFDVLGPLARSVHDAALVMDVITGDKGGKETYAAAAAAGGCRATFKGARFGMPWARVWQEASLRARCAHQYRTLQEVMDKMRDAGAEIVTADLPAAAEIIPPNGWDWGYHSRKGRPWECELVVIETDFYNDIATYLRESIVDNPNNLQSLEDIIAWNVAHTDVEGGVPGTHPAWPSGQDLFEGSAKTKGHEGEHYHSAMRYLRTKSREEGIDAALKISSSSKKKDDIDGGDQDAMLDGLLVPVQADRLGAIQVAAKAGYPVICIPVGVDPSTGVPFGMGIIHTMGQERKLFKYGAAIEDLVRGRTKPTFRNPSADNYQLV